METFVRFMAVCRPKLDRLSTAFPYFSVWLFAALATVYVKSQIVTYAEIARGLGRSEIAAMNGTRSYLFSFLERLSFYRWDLLLAFVILPLIGSLILYRVPRRWRMVCVVTATSTVLVFLYIQINGYWMVRQFQTWELWRDALQWGLQNQVDAGNYFDTKEKAKLLACLVLPCGYGILVSKRWEVSERSATFLRFLALGSYASILLVTIMSWCSRLDSTSYHCSSLSIIARSFFDLSEINLSKFRSLGPEDALAEWRKLTNSPEPKPVPDYFGVAKECDVILFVMETAPSKCLNLTDEIDDLPNLQQLKKRGWIAVDHATTYPYTSSALFSLLSSWYPTDVVDYVRNPRKNTEVPGLMRSLRASGYATAAYSPIVASKEEEALHYAVGISKLVYPENALRPGSHTSEVINWRYKAELDKSALELLKKDLSGWIRDNKRYAVLYLPQIGHGPWPNITQDETNLDTISRGRKIIALQDQWLGELVKLLEASGRLNRTIILVTSDHGIRTKLEDPDFVGGAVDSSSFHVPFVLFAPQARKQAEVIPWMTSHIDLSPSILDLVGVTNGRRFELGSPLWDRRLSKRTTFLFANKYFGADGFHTDGKFFMWHYLTDATFYNSKLSFDRVLPLHKDSTVDRYVSRTISDSRALIHRISRLASKSGAEHSSKRLPAGN